MQPLRLAETLSDYLKIATENPPGREMPALEFLDGILKQQGLEPVIHETAPLRGVLECSIGPSEGGSIVLLHHVDVVPATNEGWDVPPYSGEVRDGYIWGRGALDMKGMGIMELGAFLAMTKNAGALKKRVTYLAVSDEEQGGTFGARWVADNLIDRMRPELVINEGGAGVKDVLISGTAFVVEVTQKAAMKLKLVATGTPGHGSSPPPTYATKSLVLALDRVLSHRFDAHITPVVAEMLVRMSMRMSGVQRTAMKNAGNPVFQRFLAGKIAEHPQVGSMIRTSVSLTMLAAGDAPNSIPGRAEAVLDIRVLPGHEPAEVVKTIEGLVAEYGVRVEHSELPSTPQVSPFDSEHFRIIERALKSEIPDALVVPYMSTGATDSRFFRGKGVPCYGVMPAVMSPEDMSSVHGYNEKISVDNLEMGARVLANLLRELCL